MAKAEHEKPCETEPIDNTLDAVLISALRENFEIKNGYHIDRNEILEFLRSVINKHPELNFVLQHRDTKLSSRIYKAFPKVTTKRVAVPNIRGKKTWTYTNLRRITNQKDSQSKQDVKSHKKQITRASKSDLPKEPLPVAEPSIIPKTKRERKGFKSKRSVQGASMVHRDSLYETYRRERESSVKNTCHVGHIPQQSYLGRFNDMLKWVKEHYVLDKNSTIQVKHVVESIKAEFKINITYKQSHKLIFAVFPGVTSRVPEPVKIVAQGGFYSYRGIAPKPKQTQVEEDPVIAETDQTPLKPSERENFNQSISVKQTWVPPYGSSENGRKRIMRTRRRFIEACAVLKPAEAALVSPVRYDVSPIPSDGAPVSSEILHKSPGIVPRYPDVPPMISDMATIERENNWRRMIDELKQERDQAIVERNQAMVSLMEIEREQTTRSPDDLPLRPATCPEVLPSAARQPKSEERRRENPDWLKSLVTRSNSILGEQITEANAGYFPGSALQSAGCNQRYPKQGGYTGDYIEIERYETLKHERDAIWKNWMDKMRAEKDDIIQQLKLDKMEVIQRMELEKSDAVECVEEKLSNQITILTREMRELKELLNHTMNERALAIEHGHKLMELVDEEKLKEAGLESFPFDVTKDHVVHLPKQKTTDETVTQKTLMCLGKGNKRKQSMPAKLKKIPRLDSSVSALSEECSDSIPRNESPTVSTDSKNLLSDCESNVPTSDDNVAYGIETAVDGAGNAGATMESAMVSLSPVVGVDKDLPVAQTTYTTTLDLCKTPPVDSPETAFPFHKQREVVSAEKHTSSSSANNVLGSDTSTEISKKLESPMTEVSNTDISEKSYDTFVASIAEKIEQAKNIVYAGTKDSETQIDNSGTVCFNAHSDEKESPEILKSVNESIGSFPVGCSSSSKIGISLPSDTNSEKNITGTSTTVPCTMNLNSENFAADNRASSRASPEENNFLGKYEATVPSNTQKYLSKTLGNLYSAFASNSGKYLREVPQALPASANSNFQKYVNEIPRTVPSSALNTDIQKFSPGIPRTVSNSESEFLAQESPKSFEESVNSTFLKYFPELPKSSFNSPLTAESSKYFRDVSRTACSSVNSDSEKHLKDPGNQALVCPDEESFSRQSKVSSIDFLNSMVENIGKSSSE